MVRNNLDSTTIPIVLLGIERLDLSHVSVIIPDTFYFDEIITLPSGGYIGLSKVRDSIH